MPFLRRAALARLALALALLTPPSLAAPPTAAGADQLSWPFVYRAGSELYLQGEPFQFSGFNIYYANNLRNDGCSNLPLGQGPELAAELAEWGSGFNVLRSWFFQNLAQTDIAGDGGVRDWSAFDHTLAAADAAGLKVIATLTDQWGECGDGGVNGFKTSSWYQSGYREGVDFGNLVSYRDWVREVVTRYRDDPRIAFWQLINEGEVKESANAACLPGAQSFPIFKSWAADVSALVKSIDPNHLVSLGTMGGGQCGAQFTEYKELHALPTVDLCEYHDYSPGQAMPGDPFNGLAFRAEQCAALDKPLFVGEVGITPNDIGGTLADRAVRLDDKLREQRALGIDGHVAWAWVVGPSRLDTFDIGAGDPVLGVLPHAPSTSTELVSVSTDGAQGDDHSGNGVGDTDISADGRTVAFTSRATTLAANVAPSTPNLFVRDRARGTTEAVAVGLGGAAADGFSHAPALSATGRHVAFRSFASNLVSGDTNGLVDVFVRDRLLDTTARVSVATDGTEMTGDSAFGAPDISADGRFVVFASQGAQLIPQVLGPTHSRIYLHDRDADADRVFDEPGQTTTRNLDATADGSLGSGASGRPTISSSGRFIAFHSESTNLVADDVPACVADEPPTSTTEPAPSETPPEPGSSAEPPPLNVNCIDVFLVDRDADGNGVLDDGPRSVEIVSRAQDGTQADGPSLSPSVADDGDVAFASSSALLGSDDGGFDALVRDRQTGVIHGAGTSISNLTYISPNGRYVGYDSHVANGTGETRPGVDAFLFDRASGLSALVNIGSAGNQGSQGGALAIPSRDGRFISFISFSSDLVVGDSNALVDVFVRDLAQVPPPPGATSVGANVSVDPVYAPLAASPVSVTFASVTASGVTTISAVDDIGAAPSGFAFGDPALAWEIETTATYSGPITVCFRYGEGDVVEPDGSLFHFHDGAWTNITTSLDAEANLICGSTTSLSAFAVGIPDVPSIFVETADLATYDHAVLWIAEVVDPTSIPRPSDFTLTIDGIAEPITDVEFVYHGLIGSQLLVEGLGFERGSAFVELRWSADAPAGADIVLDYTPGAHPFRTPDGRELLPITDLTLERVDASGLSLAFVDEGAGPDQLVVFLGWQLDSALPDPADFSINATSWSTAQAPTAVTRRAPHLGATFLYLQLPQDVLPDDSVTIGYTPGANPILLPDGTHFTGVLDDHVSVSLSPTSSRTTPIGEDVTVTPKESGSGGEYATLQFESVTAGGTTTLTATDEAPPLPAGFTVGDPPTYYDIETTATFDGAITVCIRYGAADYTDPSTIRLFHFENDAWTDVTTSHDPAAQTVCGVVSSLSPFAVVERDYEIAGFFSPVNAPPTLNLAKPGSAIPMKFRLGGDFGLDVFAEGTPFSRRVACPTEAPTDSIETVVAGNSGLTYDPESNQYSYVWKTQKSWSGTCREFVATFENGDSLEAIFRFGR